MIKTSQREQGRQTRHRRIRRKVVGYPERPRLSLFRSHKNLFAQIIDDTKGVTVFGLSTKDKRVGVASGGNLKAAEALGKLIASEAAQRGIKRVVFDRGGYAYHGRVKTFTEAVRAGGIQV